MAVVFSNNAVTTLSASISAGVTQFSVVSNSGFPTISGSNYTYLTVGEEVVKVTGISGTTFTCDATSSSHASGDNVELRMTSQLLNDFATDLEAMPKTGGTFTGNVSLNDNVVLGLGSDSSSGSDLILYHDGTNAFVNTSTGSLRLSTADAGSSVQILGSGETLAEFTDDGDVDLFHNGTLKFSTTATGVNVVGNVAVSGTVDGVDIQTLNTAVSANTAKTGITSGQSSAITANTAKTGITSGQASAITANTAKVTNATHTGDVTGATALTIGADKVTTAKILNANVTTAKIADANITTAKIADDAVTIDKLANSINTAISANTAKTGITSGQASAITANTAKVTNATHTGDVTGATTLAIGTGKVLTAMILDDNVTAAKLANSINTDIATGVTANTTANNALPKAGGTMTGDLNFGDSDVIQMGAGNDLRIYHDGSNSYIDDADVGKLHIRSNEILLQKYTGETLLQATADGAVSLNHDNSVKFATTATGATLTGNLAVTGTVDGIDIQTLNTTANASLPKAGGTMTGNIVSGDNVKATYGADADLEIYHDGSASRIKDQGTGDLIISGANVRLSNANGSENFVHCADNGAVNLYYDGNNKLTTASGGVTITGDIYLSDSAILRSGGEALISRTDPIIEIGSGDSQDYLKLKAGGSERMRITADGTVIVYKSSRGTLTTDNDGSFDLNASNNFKCTPAGNFALTFTNIASQSGNILFINSGGHTISAHANTKVDANLLATISTAGTYLLAYFSDGTNVYMTNSAAYA